MTNILPFRAPSRNARRQLSDFFHRDWMALHEPAWGELAKDREMMTGETWRVLFCMVGHTEESNHIRMGAVHVAEELGIGPGQAQRAIKRLAAKGVLRKGKMYGWRLDPLYGYKGDPTGRLGRAPDGTLVLLD